MNATWESIKTSVQGLPHSWVLAAGVAVAAFIVTVLGIFFWKYFSRTRKESREKKGQLVYIQGLNHMLGGQTAQAVQCLTRAVKLDGSNVDAYLRLGTLFRASGQPGRAVRIHKSLLMRPNLPEQLTVNAVYELALDYSDAGELDKAADVLQKVTSLDANHVVALDALRTIYEKARRWEDAVETGKRLLRVSKSKDRRSLSPLHLAWGTDLVGEGRTDNGIQALRQAIKCDPRNTAAHIALGDVLFDTEQTKAAIAAWEQLMKENPESFSYALERLERAYFAIGQYDDLRKVYMQHLETYPDDARVRLALAEFYIRRARLDEARKELERIGEDSLGSIKANLHLARIEKKEEGEEEGPWKTHLKAAMGTLSELSRTFQCRACDATRREYFWRCPKCGELDSAVKAFQIGG